MTPVYSTGPIIRATTVVRSLPGAPSVTYLTSEFRDRVSAVTSQYIEPIAERTTRLTEVASPTGGEAARAHLLSHMFRDDGYASVEVDALSDVTARIEGVERSKTILLAAHIDTVFPHFTDVTVKREGNRLHAPGVGDNTISVAAVTLVKRMLDQLGIVPDVDLLVTGNVGEEGLGDLRGMRAVVDAHPEIGGAIALEGHSLGSVTHVGVGSRRLEVTFKGPGGHSWGAFGRPSAIHAAANAVSRLDEIDLPTDPKTTLNIGIFEGGISVNTIAPEARLVIDMRSVEQESLETLVSQVNGILSAAGTNEINVGIKVVGDRPAGRLPKDSGVAGVAANALSLLGLEPIFHPSSTDANIPISRNIPSACIGLAGGGNVHRDDEFIDLDPIPTGLTQLILVTLESARLLRNGTL